MEIIILFGIINQSLLQMITLALLSILRYYAISFHRTFSGQRVILTYTLIYTVALSAFSIPIWRSDIPFTILPISVALIHFILQAAVVLANVMLLIYVRVIESENHVNNINIDCHKRAIKTILLLSISFISCASPSAVIVAIYAFLILKGEYDSSDDLKECMQLSYLLFTLYSGINSVIYICRCKNIVAYYKHIFMNYFGICRAYSSCSRVTEIGNREEMSTTL